MTVYTRQAFQVATGWPGSMRFLMPLQALVMWERRRPKAGTADLRHDCLQPSPWWLTQPQQHRGSVLWWRSCGNSPDLGIRRHRREPWPCSAAWNCRHHSGVHPKDAPNPCSYYSGKVPLQLRVSGKAFALPNKRERLGYHCSFPHSFFFSFEQKHDGWSKGSHMRTWIKKMEGKLREQQRLMPDIVALNLFLTDEFGWVEYPRVSFLYYNTWLRSSSFGYGEVWGLHER